MKARVIKSEQQFKEFDDLGYNIIRWDSDNSFPQKIKNIISNSGTGSACLDVYIDYVTGKGLNEDDLKNLVVNSDGETLNKIYLYAIKDYCTYKGCAFFINVNAQNKITELKNVAFENIRLGLPNDQGQITYCALYDNWDRSNRRTIKRDRIEYIDLWTTNREEAAQRIAEAGGYDYHEGFIVYFGEDAQTRYPTPKYVSRITDMRAEEGLSNVLSRNVCSNLLPAGLLVDYMNQDPDEQETEKTKQNLRTFQGDAESCQVMYIQIDNPLAKPEFISFSGENYDKQFTTTASYLPEVIGKIFKQPAELRAEKTSKGYSTDVIKPAVTFYNSVTERDRDFIEEVFKKLLDNWHISLAKYDVKIIELSYTTGSSIIEKYGSDVATHVTEIALRTDIDPDQKYRILSVVYGIDDTDVEFLLNIKI